MAARAFARIAPARAKVLFYLLVAMAAYLLWRLYDVQIIQGPALAREAAAQRAEQVEIFARRGSILDRDGVALVTSHPSESIYADPAQVTEKRQAAEALAPILHVPADDLERTFKEENQFRWLARKVPHDVADKVRALNLDGISIVQEDSGVRDYRGGRLAANVIGFVGIDENGLDGAEYEYDSLLKGTPGRISLEADEFGRPIPFGQTTTLESAHPGKSIELTIDSYIQFELERALRAQVKAYSAKSATGIVMDPWTGEIYAIANVPDYDPAHYAKATDDARRDRAVEDAYEPGSTFKLITAAAAIGSGKVTTKSRFPARDALQIGGNVIHNAEDGFMAGTGGTESLEDIIAYSHNVGAAEVGMALGKQTLYDTIRSFGFGDPTEVGLPGENPGIVPAPDDWWGSTIATISFGHGVSVTPIALIRAYAAIANGGTLVRPRILKAILDRDGTPVYTYGTEIEHQVMTTETAATLRHFLRAVVVRGTGNPTAQVRGYTTAGKTGTAQVVQNGRYEPGAYIASFVGFIPAERPRFVILIKVTEPRGAIYGSVVAAPVFAKVAQLAMLHDGEMPQPTPAPHRTLSMETQTKDAVWQSKSDGF